MAFGGVAPRVASQWARVRGVLRAEVGESAYKSWLKPMTLLEVGAGTVTISVPTRFMRDWVVGNYGDRISELWMEEDNSINSIDIVIQTEPARHQEASHHVQ